MTGFFLLFFFFLSCIPFISERGVPINAFTLIADISHIVMTLIIVTFSDVIRFSDENLNDGVLLSGSCSCSSEHQTPERSRVLFYLGRIRISILWYNQGFPDLVCKSIMGGRGGQKNPSQVSLSGILKLAESCQTVILKDEFIYFYILLTTISKILLFCIPFISERGFLILQPLDCSRPHLVTTLM